MGSLHAAESILRCLRRQAEQFDFVQGNSVIVFFVRAFFFFFFSLCFVLVLFCVFQGMDNWYLFFFFFFYFYFPSLYQFCLVLKFVDICLLFLYLYLYFFVFVYGLSSIDGDECSRCVVARSH